VGVTKFVMLKYCSFVG